MTQTNLQLRRSNPRISRPAQSRVRYSSSDLSLYDITSKILDKSNEKLGLLGSNLSQIDGVVEDDLIENWEKVISKNYKQGKSALRMTHPSGEYDLQSILGVNENDVKQRENDVSSVPLILEDVFYQTCDEDRNDFAKGFCKAAKLVEKSLDCLYDNSRLAAQILGRLHSYVAAKVADEKEVYQDLRCLLSGDELDCHDLEFKENMNMIKESYHKLKTMKTNVEKINKLEDNYLIASSQVARLKMLALKDTNDTSGAHEVVYNGGHSLDVTDKMSRVRVVRICDPKYV
jgi:hypothetical protein